MNERLFEKLSGIVDGQKKLAEFLNVSPQTVSAWKSRGTPPPTKYVPQIAVFLNVSVEWLMTGKNTIESSVVAHDIQEYILSDEAAELLRIYDSLDVKRRHKLLNLAFELEEGLQVKS